MRSVFAAAVVVALSLSLACTGKKETPGVVGNQYPHETKDVTGSFYQSSDTLSNKAGVQRDTEKVRGPSLEPLNNPSTITTPTTEKPPETPPTK